MSLNCLASALMAVILSQRERKNSTCRKLKFSLLEEKQKDFSVQKCTDLQPEKSLSGGFSRRTKHRFTGLYGCQTES